MKKLFSIMTIWLLTATVAFAATAPVTFLQGLANQVLAQLQANKAKLKGNPKIVYGIVTRIILPHINQVRMAKQVVNRTTWENASKADQAEFLRQFRQIAMRTYASAFRDYTNETVKFFPVRGGLGQEVQVNSMIIRPGKPSIPVSYRLERSGDGWKIYDFSVEGVSMVKSFRAQFASVSAGGLKNLIAALKRHNAARGG